MSRFLLFKIRLERLLRELVARFEERDFFASVSAQTYELHEHEPTLPGFERSAVLPAVVASPALAEPSEPEAVPQQVQGTVLYGSVLLLEEFAQTLGAEAAFAAYREFLGTAERLIRAAGGEFAGETETAFLGLWRDSKAPDPRALRCAIDLRKEFIRFNGIRKVDGEKELALCMGIDTGPVFWAPEPMHLIGDLLARARKLAELAPSLGTDLLVSEEAWEPHRQEFRGTRAGEGKLTPESGLRVYFSAAGYQEEGSREIIVPPFVPKKTAGLVSLEPRWLVNNGSQMLGPLTASEIALRLFAQELDFDSACWDEASGKPAEIVSAGIFSGSPETGADLWVFDGKTVHGPMGEGFLKTALSRGAIQETDYFCERTTLQGWKKLAQWEPWKKRAEARTGVKTPEPASSAAVPAKKSA